MNSSPRGARRPAGRAASDAVTVPSEEIDLPTNRMCAIVGGLVRARFGGVVVLGSTS